MLSVRVVLITYLMLTVNEYHFNFEIALVSGLYRKWKLLSSSLPFHLAFRPLLLLFQKKRDQSKEHFFVC